MCGLFGMYSPFGLDMDNIRDLQYLGTVIANRGLQGCGFIRGLDDLSLNYMKTELPVPAAMWDDTVEDFLYGTDRNTYKAADGKSYYKERINLIMGHNRHATIGGVKEDNNHPFDFENVIGMHNGTIEGFLDNSDKFNTDSMKLYSMLDKAKSSKDIQETLRDIVGYSTSTAYALSWVDKKNDKLMFLRNSQRPLHFAYYEAGKVLVWASTKEHIKFVIDYMSNRVLTDFTGVEMHDRHFDQDKYKDLVSVDKLFRTFSPDKNVLITFDLADEYKGHIPEFEKLTIPEYSWYGMYGNHNTYTYRNGNYYYGGTKKDTPPLKPDKKPPWDGDTFSEKYNDKALKHFDWLSSFQEDGEPVKKKSEEEDNRPSFSVINNKVYARGEIEDACLDGCMCCGIGFEYTTEEDIAENISQWLVTDVADLAYICTECVYNGEANSIDVDKFTSNQK